MQNILYLTELFESIQGESRFSGRPSTFIRLSGCNLRCTWCDTSYSFKRGQAFSLEAIIQQTQAYTHPHVCVTGGEPLLQAPCNSLMKQLCQKGFIVSLETSGSLDIKPVDPRVHVILDVKCPGSGMEDKNKFENLKLIHEKDDIKFVLKDRSDYLFAKRICHEYKLYDKTSQILLSPVFDELNPQELIAWILEDKLPFKLNLQIHKFIWHPNTQGV